MPIRRTDKKPPVSSVESVYEFSEGDMNIEFIDYRLPRYRFRGSRACTALSALREEKRAVQPAGMRRAEQARRNTGCTCRRCLAAALLYPTYPFPNIYTQSHRFLSVSCLKTSMRIGHAYSTYSKIFNRFVQIFGKHWRSELTLLW